MGIIQKQTLKGSVYSYLGLLIGFLNIGILSPRIFTAEQIGLTQVMLSIATILSQVGNMGFTDLANRIFPWFRDSQNANRGFLGLGILITGIGTVIVTILLIINIEKVINTNSSGDSLLTGYSGLLPVLLILIIWFTFFDNYVKMLYNAVLGTFLRDLLIRGINLTLIALFFFKRVDFDTYILLYVLNQGVLPIVILIIYLYRRGELVPGRFWEWIDRKMARELISLGFNGLIVGFSWIAVTNIDKYMINYYIGLDQAGIYSVSFYFATIIMIPGRSLGKIAVPLIADAWKRNDLKTVSDIYTRSCINQIVIGTLLVAGIIGNIGNIYRILPGEYGGGTWIIILISLANFASNASGASLYVIAASGFYRYQTWLMLFLIVMVVVLNMILIPLIGIEGAALASLAALLANSILKVCVIYYKTGIWPYRLKDLVTVASGAILILLSLLLPRLPLIPDIMVRSAIIALPFLFIIYILDLSAEAKGIIGNFLKRIPWFGNSGRRRSDNF